MGSLCSTTCLRMDTKEGTRFFCGVGSETVRSCRAHSAADMTLGSLSQSICRNLPCRCDTDEGDLRWNLCSAITAFFLTCICGWLRSSVTCGSTAGMVSSLTSLQMVVSAAHTTR